MKGISIPAGYVVYESITRAVNTIRAHERLKIRYGVNHIRYQGWTVAENSMYAAIVKNILSNMSKAFRFCIMNAVKTKHTIETVME